jgi:metal-responsive CopG/Arc/MetJ family transcriptional regulator
MKVRVRTVRLQVHLTQKEMQAIDDFWFTERLSNKAEAVRELLRRGIAATKAE